MVAMSDLGMQDEANEKESTLYSLRKLEPKWEAKWETGGIYDVDLASCPRPYYNLMMFPSSFTGTCPLCLQKLACYYQVLAKVWARAAIYHGGPFRAMAPSGHCPLAHFTIIVLSGHVTFPNG